MVSKGTSSGSPIIPFAFSKNFFEGSKYFTGNKEKVSLIKSISSFSFSAVKLWYGGGQYYRVELDNKTLEF